MPVALGDQLRRPRLTPSVFSIRNQSRVTRTTLACTEAWPTQPAIHRPLIGGGEGRGFSVRGARVSRFSGAAHERSRDGHGRLISSPMSRHLPRRFHARHTPDRHSSDRAKDKASPLKRGSARRPSRANASVVGACTGTTPRSACWCARRLEVPERRGQRHQPSLLMIVDPIA